MAGAECICADGLNAATDSNSGKLTTAEECIIINSSCALDYNTLKRAASEECVSSNNLNACGNNNALNVAVLKCIVSNSNYGNTVNLRGDNNVLIFAVAYAGECITACNGSIGKTKGYLMSAVSANTVCIEIMTVCGNNLLLYSLVITSGAVLTCGETVVLTIGSRCAKRNDIVTKSTLFHVGGVIAFGAILVCVPTDLGTCGSLCCVLGNLMTKSRELYLVVGITALGAAGICVPAAFSTGGSLRINNTESVVCNSGNIPGLTSELYLTDGAEEYSVVRA